MTTTAVEVTGGDGNVIRGDLYGTTPVDAYLLHGGGQTRHAWGATGSRLLENGLNTLRIDLRGHGESDWHPDGRYAFPDHARDLAAVIEATGADDVILIGASLGGVTSLKYASLHPERLRAVVLVDITPTMQLTGVDRIVGFMRANPDGFESLDDAAAAIARYQPHRKRQSSPGGLRRNLRHNPATGRWEWHWDPQTLTFATPDWYIKQTHDMVAGVRALEVPAILIRGAESDVILPEDVSQFLALGPHTSSLDVPEARHMVAGDQNEVFLTEILKALRSKDVLPAGHAGAA
jgi:pimeloyl-ACP methyl ester carboxylesterase